MLASSSAGNCIYIATPEARILIDAGISRKQTLERLAAAGEDPERIDAIFITHEHSDHIAGLPALVKGFAARGRHVPVYLTQRTAPMLDWNGYAPDLRCFQAGALVEFSGLHIQSFTIPHDATDPVGYTITAGAAKLAIATDLGYIPDSVKWHLRGSRLILLESNHDPSMLQVGPVPWAVKQRILSRQGHLSNAAACEYISSELPAEVETLILGHLSENHNVPYLAEHDAREALQRRGLAPQLVVAEPRKPSVLFHL